LALVCGLLVAGGVHAIKATARPVVTATTGGTGNWLVSIVEDVLSFITSVLAILVPIVILFLIVLLIISLAWWWSRRRRARYAG
jgi:hypothetical protein